MSKKDVYVYTPTVNIEKYEKLDSEERKDYLSLDKRMHRITEGFAYDVGKVLKDAQEKFRNQGRKDRLMHHHSPRRGVQHHRHVFF